MDDQPETSSMLASWLSAVQRPLMWFRGVAMRTSPVAIGLALVGLAIAIHLPTLNQPLLETQSFRQTTTAYPALLFHLEGINLFRPQVPVFGPPFLLPIEFPLFQAAASLVMDFGMAPDPAVRLTALACFSITALLVWRLLVAVAGQASALAGLAAFLFSPLGLLASRMSLMEYMATAGAVAFVYWGLRWHETGKWPWYVAALVAGTVGLLVKSTTGVIYLVPLMVLVVGVWFRGKLPVSRRSVYAIAIVVLFGLPLLVAAGWTVYADGVRAANPESAWFSSSGGLAGSYLGTMQQKLDPTTWFNLADLAQSLLFGGALWLLGLLALAAGMLLTRRTFAISLVLSACIGPLLFTYQYLVPGQEYYFAAISPLVAIAVGMAVGWVWRERHKRVGQVVLISLALGWAITLHLSQGYWGRQFIPVDDTQQILPAAEFVAAHTQPGELVALAGDDWDPSIFYYARREGLMVRGAVEPDVYARLREFGYTRLFVCPLNRPSPATACDIVDLTPK